MCTAMKEEFKINEYITVKLESGKTNIYIDGKLFQQCKILLLNLPVEKINSFNEINSIDEAAEALDFSMETNPHEEFEIPANTEFWGHCSNLQVWVEHNYDTRLLHRSLSFPMLKELTDVGDQIARRVFKEEIVLRFLTGVKSVILFLIDYLDYFSLEELR